MPSWARVSKSGRGVTEPVLAIATLYNRCNSWRRVVKVELLLWCPRLPVWDWESGTADGIRSVREQNGHLPLRRMDDAVQRGDRCALVEDTNTGVMLKHIPRHYTTAELGATGFGTNPYDYKCICQSKPNLYFAATRRTSATRSSICAVPTWRGCSSSRFAMSIFRQFCCRRNHAKSSGQTSKA